MILFWHNFLSQWYNAAAGSVLSSSIRIFIWVTMSQSETWCCDYWPIRSHFILKWRSTKSIRQNIHEKYSLVDVVGCAVQVSIFTLVSDLTRILPTAQCYAQIDKTCIPRKLLFVFWFDCSPDLPPSPTSSLRWPTSQTFFSQLCPDNTF